MKDSDFLFLTSMLRAREVGMISGDKIDRMLDAPGFDGAAKLLMDSGYPDMSEMSLDQIDRVLEERRFEMFSEIHNFRYAQDVLDLFRLKYDYHNVKVLVKSSGANVDAAYLLSSAGRIGTKTLSEAFITEQHADLPPNVAAAMSSAMGILSRTGNPQLADIEVDKAYFNELTSLAEWLKEEFITGYIKLMIDSANIRIIVRSARTGRGKDFLLGVLIPGGSVNIEQIASSYEESGQLPFAGDALEQAVRLGGDAMKGGAQTLFELACDNAVLQYVTNTTFISFGPAPVISFLAKFEWEITVVRMILTGKYTDISPDVIRERLRECHV